MQSNLRTSLPEEERYFLPDDYVANPQHTVRQDDNGSAYWTRGRLRASFYHQYGVYRYALKQLQQHHLTSLVDIGCGPGVKLKMIADKLPQVRIHGIDQPFAIKYCEQHYSFGNWRSDNFENPYSFEKEIQGDLVICADVIEHVRDPDKLLEYIRRYMHKESRLILSTPDRDRLHGPNMRTPRNKDHVREWNKEEFFSFLRSRGWNVLQHFHSAGVCPGFNRPFLSTFLSHITRRRPFSLNYNQVALVMSAG